MESWGHALSGSLGKLWRQNRRRLTPSIRKAFAELLLEIRVEFLPPKYLDKESSIGHAKNDPRGITELLKQISARDEDILTAMDTALKNLTAQDRASTSESNPFATPDRQSLEIKSLKRDISNLQADVVRMTATHHNQMSNLRCKLQDSADVISQSMSTFKAQVAQQADCLAKVCRAMPTDVPD